MRQFLHLPLLLVAWVLTRWHIHREAFGVSMWIFGDVNYYFDEMAKERAGGIALREYPEANLWLLRPLDRLCELTGWEHRLTYICFILLVDAFFLIALAAGKHWRSSWFWVAFGLVSGPIFISRLDLIPGMLVGMFALFLSTRPRVAAALLALATMMKLWPGVLATALVGPIKQSATWIRLAVFGLSMCGLALVTVVTRGVDRLLSPLDYQTVRGLQIESVAASPFMYLAAQNPGSYRIWYATSKSFEIAGPGVDKALILTSIAMQALLILAIVEVVLRCVSRTWQPNPSLALAIVLILGLLVTNKVLSPQYMMWLGPILAVALSRSKSWWLNVMTIIFMAVTYLTYYVFPAHYGDIIGGIPRVGVTNALVARNVLLLVMLVLAIVWWRREVRSAKQPAQPIAAQTPPV